MIIWFCELTVDPKYNPARSRVYVEPGDGPLRFAPMTVEESLAKPYLNDVETAEQLIGAMQYALHHDAVVTAS